jgi:hypothetical protein
MAQAKRDFSIGYLTECKLVRVPLSNDWTIQLGSGLSRGFLVDARTKERRQFKSLDSAVSTLEQIGFEVIELMR